MQVSDVLPEEGLVAALVQCGGELRAKPEKTTRLLRPLGLRCHFVTPLEKLPELLPVPATCA